MKNHLHKNIFWALFYDALFRFKKYFPISLKKIKPSTPTQHSNQITYIHMHTNLHTDMEQKIFQRQRWRDSKQGFSGEF